ncbi:MAG TPA: alpha/beta fold hydrolase [Candidatus Limnocylindrales bacterium]|nr:alpha/beta fold hydrolase [Candidatus Limnocylindrales bacterium]
MTTAAVSYTVPGATLTEREHSVPLNHDAPSGETISVFTREVAAAGGEDRPYLVFLQGGPGHEATRPTAPPVGWQKRALEDYRLLLLDQRGTGRSTPVGEIPGETPQAQADYLANFRADSIVRDAELIRQELGVDRWSLLGQSFGGFCTMTYLSVAPEAVREAMITGGVSPIGHPVDDVYSTTYRRMIDRSRAYFERYPEDQQRMRDLLLLVENEDVRLPSGDRLTAGRVRQLGMPFGMSYGFETVHHILELPFGSRPFLHDVEATTRFGRNPLYATVHEACYADGGATRWSGDRLLPDEIVERHYFTGEHIFRWMWQDEAALRSHKGAADILAEREWPRLYDPGQLAQNEVPVAATIYVEDPYVDRGFAEESARLIRGMRPWITNEYLHDGLRTGAEALVGRLIDMARNRI